MTTQSAVSAKQGLCLPDGENYTVLPQNTVCKPDYPLRPSLNLQKAYGREALPEKQKGPQ